MSRKIYGVTVGTPMSISAIKDKLKPITSVNGVEADENGNVEITIPDSGGNADYVGVEPAEEDIPKVFISGVKPTTKDDVLAEMEYISKTDRFHAYLEIKCQGSSSMDYPKKNYTVKMYSDETRETKQKKVFKNWNHESNKFVLKANWIDHSHARNIVSARIWDEVVKSRVDYTTLPEEMRNSPRNGAIDGFPVKLYYNGTYEGLYTWNIGKDAWMWDMDEDNANHVLLCAEVNNNGEEVDTSCNFRSLWTTENAWEWEVEVGERTEAIVSSFNALISCIKDTDDETFKRTIGNHLDIQSAIDYWIHQYVICNMDGLGKNLLMATYDGVKWICGSYDMDGTFGLSYGGDKFVSTQFRFPEDCQENRSLLWERICTVFADEVNARYRELREKVYTYANLFNHFERFTDVIGSELYAEDLIVYPDIPCAAANNIRQIRTYIKDRLYYTDIQFGLIVEPETEKTVIVSDYVQSSTDEAVTFEVYSGPVDWNTQGLVMELAMEPANADGILFYVGENINSVDDDFSFSAWCNEGRQYMKAYIQSGNVNGSWNQCLIGNLYTYIPDWSHIKLEISKNGIYVNDNNIAANASAADVYAILLERLLSKTSLQIGKKSINEALYPVTFKSVYFYELD